LELDLAVTRVNQRRERQEKKAAKMGGTLKPISDTLAPEPANEHAGDEE
jgi:hypothetical protein